MNPFEVLGLDAEERDPVVIRKAYAVRLREHRPDEDPEGFRRVRQAYEILKGWIREEDEESESHPDVAEETAQRDEFAPLTERRLREEQQPGAAIPLEPDPPAEAPREHPAVVAWREAVSRKSTPGGRKALEHAAVRLTKAMRAESRLMPFWSNALAAEFGDEDDFLLRNIGDDDLLAELRAGFSGVSRCVLGRAQFRRRYDRLVDFAKRLLDSPKRSVEEHSAGNLLYRLALALAIPWPFLARRLVDRAFAVLPPGEREWFPLDRLDEMMLAGEEIRNWDSGDRYLVASLLDREYPLRPSGPIRKVLERARNLDRDSLLRALLVEEVPDFRSHKKRIHRETRFIVLYTIVGIILVKSCGSLWEDDWAVERSRELLQDEEYRKRSKELLDAMEEYRGPDGRFDNERWLDEPEPPPR